MSINLNETMNKRLFAKAVVSKLHGLYITFEYSLILGDDHIIREGGALSGLLGSFRTLFVHVYWIQ